MVPLPGGPYDRRVTRIDDGPLTGAVVHADGPVPAGLLEALAAYEQALMGDDVAAMDALFAPGPATVRGDPSGLVVGHQQIHDFRVGRGGAPPPRGVDVHVQRLGPDAAVVVAVTARLQGGQGLQTQVWRRSDVHPGPAGWAVVAAHVS